MPYMKRFFHLWIAHLSALKRWICGGFGWKCSSTSVIKAFKYLGDLLSKWCIYGLKPRFTTFFWIMVYAVTSYLSDLTFMGWDRMLLDSKQYTIITSITKWKISYVPLDPVAEYLHMLELNNRLRVGWKTPPNLKFKLKIQTQISNSNLNFKD